MATSLLVGSLLSPAVYSQPLTEDPIVLEDKRIDKRVRFEEYLWRVSEGNSRFILPALTLRYSTPLSLSYLKTLISTPNIARLQRELKRKFGAPIDVDGIWGPKTASLYLMDKQLTGDQIREYLEYFPKHSVENFIKNYREEKQILGNYPNSLIQFIQSNKSLTREDLPIDKGINLIKKSPLPPLYKERVIKALGKPYFLGGRSLTYGFDCTGLISYIVGGSLSKPYPTSNYLWANTHTIFKSRTQIRDDRAYVLVIDRDHYRTRYDPHSRFGHAALIFKNRDGTYTLIEATSNADKVRVLLLDKNSITGYYGWKIMDIWDYRIIMRNYNSK